MKKSFLASLFLLTITFTFAQQQTKIEENNYKLPSSKEVDLNLKFAQKITVNTWNKNELGVQIFEEMFKNNSIEEIFKFLDNEGTLLSDLSIIKSFSPTPFLSALGKRILSR